VLAVNRGESTGEVLVRGCRIEHVTMPALDIASSNIRLRIRNGQVIRHLVPRAVEEYLLEHGVYK
jgi:nicotinate-nucleotide adenylyltransferase